MTSLNPLHTIEQQVGEVLKIHRGTVGHARRASACSICSEKVGIDDPEGTAPVLSASAFRRAAAAGDDRHGARQRARPADRRRADHRARRDHPGADPRPPAQAQGRVQHGDAADHPRSRHRAQDGRPGLRHEQRRDRRAGHDARASSPRRSIPTPSISSRRSPRARRRRPTPRRRPSSKTKDLRVWFPIKRGFLRHDGRPYQGGRRHRSRRQGGPDARRRRRVGLGQDHARSGAAQAGVERGADRLSRRPHRRLRFQAHAPAQAPHADRVPGPLRLALAAPFGRADHRGGPGDPKSRAHPRRARRSAWRAR